MHVGHGVAVLVPLLVACDASPQERVARARRARTAAIHAKFAAAGVAYPPGEILLRALKAEGELELWAGARGAPLTLVATYPICASSGEVGPKRHRGDGQVPEGFYVVDRFNPSSSFHLSLGIDYPNEADRLRARRATADPGGDIFIHGGCATIGCIPIRDAAIEELFVIAMDARDNWQRRIPVHIFPTALDERGVARLLQRERPSKELRQFWLDLAGGFGAFERTRRPPRIRVDRATGRYVVED